MTGYHLSVGYISGYTVAQNKEDAWGVLRSLALSLCSKDKIGEVIENASEVENIAIPQGYADRYVLRDDRSIVFLDEKMEIMQLAGGSGEARRMKEAMRRAFCRVVIAKAHRLGIEVNLVVA